MARNIRIKSGMSRTTTHAPEVNLVEAITRATINVVNAPTPLIMRLRFQPGCSLRSRVTFEYDQQQARQDGQGGDASRERESIAAECELVRQEVVACQQGRQAGEVCIAGVSRQRQDEERSKLEY